MKNIRVVVLALLIDEAAAQKAGTLKAEKHPQLAISTCTKTNGCQQVNKAVTVDQNWRWMHEHGQPKNCYTGNKWDPTLCPDPNTCKSNCVIEGADEEYEQTYGIKAQGNALSLGFVTKGQYSRNVGSRTFLLDTENKYEMFKLKNREFTFDVDDSQMPCGLNGALYFVQMDSDGGMSKYPSNTAGAKYGTGYCDAQCPHDLKWINGEPNMLNWKPSATDPNAGTGKYGTCCVEMDIWEANKISTAYTAHSCEVQEQTRCEGVDCGDNASGDRFKGKCDKNGCDIQTFRLDNKTFWGPGAQFELDSTQKVTVVTQFITADGTDTGPLSEIRRFYKQGSKIVPTPHLVVGSGGMYDSLSQGFCQAEVNYFQDHTNFLQKGGFSSMDDAFTKGMVLVMSIWDDHDADMLWLDSTYPTNGTAPGDARGTCPITSGVPKDVEAKYPNSKVTYSNIRFGEIGSTVSGGPSPPGPGPSPPPTPSGCPGGSLSACIKLCPSSPPAAYSACVKECVTRCSGETELASAAAQPVTASKWGLCSANALCPTGWECTSRAGATFKQCTPTSPLVEAFHLTRPSPTALAEFFATGATAFPASGLPPLPEELDAF